MDAEAPMTHAELVESVAHLGLDRVTVYRNLVDLADAELLNRSDHGDHVWRFEIPQEDGDGPHPHFVCVDCGVVSCLDGVEVNFSRARKAPRSVTKRKVEIQIKGICDACG